jgi:Arc/MetJ-type ribon-helix-helix transcriptional regulator
MMIVTVNMPGIYIDAIAKLQENGMYPSRSEAMRVAIRDFLKKELEMVVSLLDLAEKKEKPDIAGQPKQMPKKIDMRSIRAGWA